MRHTFSAFVLKRQMSFNTVNATCIKSIAFWQETIEQLQASRDSSCTKDVGAVPLACVLLPGIIVMRSRTNILS